MVDQKHNLQPEEKEPTLSPSRDTPLLITFGLLTILSILAGWQFFYRNSGTFDSNLFYPVRSTNQLAFLNPKPQTDPFRENGRYLYNSACAPCHQPDGNGIPAQYPPLAGSEWVTAPGAARLIRILLHGMRGQITVGGAQFDNVMLPWKDLMSDSQIAAVLTFIRTEWGHRASTVTPEQVKIVREKTAARQEQWTAAELLELSEFE